MQRQFLLHTKHMLYFIDKVLKGDFFFFFLNIPNPVGQQRAYSMQSIKCSYEIGIISIPMKIKATSKRGSGRFIGVPPRHVEILISTDKIKKLFTAAATDRAQEA